MILTGSDGQSINVKTLQLDDGKMIPASKYGQTSEKEVELVLTDEEMKIKDNLNTIWQGILNIPDIADSTDFFKSGAASMDVARYVSVREVHFSFNTNFVQILTPVNILATNLISFPTPGILTIHFLPRFLACAGGKIGA